MDQVCGWTGGERSTWGRRVAPLLVPLASAQMSHLFRWASHLSLAQSICLTDHALSLMSVPFSPTMAAACLASIPPTATTTFHSVTAARAAGQWLRTDLDPPACWSLMVPRLLQDQVCVSPGILSFSPLGTAPVTATAPAALSTPCSPTPQWDLLVGIHAASHGFRHLPVFQNPSTLSFS